MLQEIISEKNLVWNKYTDNIAEKFFVKISGNVTNELKNNSNLINNSEEIFPILQQEILDFKKKILDRRYWILCNRRGMFLRFF